MDSSQFPKTYCYNCPEQISCQIADPREVCFREAWEKGSAMHRAQIAAEHAALTTTCPYCKMAIPAQAEICPYCHMRPDMKQIHENTEKAWNAVWVMAGISAIFVGGLFLFLSISILAH